MEYRIPEYNYEVLENQIDKLNRRAEKLGVPTISLEIVREELVNVAAPGHEESMVKFLDIKVEGTAPIINGWQFAATLQHTEHGNIIRTVLGFDMPIPVHYRTETQHCDHCQQNRERKDTYIVYSAEGRNFKQVGSTCLKDFLGHKSPEAYARWAEMLANFDIESLGEADLDEMFFGGGKFTVYAGLERALAVAHTLIRTDGWAPRKVDQYPGGQVSTASLMGLFFFGGKDESDLRDDIRLRIEARDEDAAKAAIKWATDLQPGTYDDYLWNIKTVAAAETITYREIGFAGAIMFSYLKERNEIREGKIGKGFKDEHFGELKTREEFVLTVLWLKVMESDWGWTTLIKFVDAESRVAVWFASGAMDEEDWCPGETYKVKARVKGHDEFRGLKQTTITRVTLIEKVEAAA